MTILSDSLTTRHKWLIFAALGSGIFLDSMEGSIVVVILPSLVRELTADFTIVQWVVLPLRSRRQPLC